MAHTLLERLKNVDYTYGRTGGYPNIGINEGSIDAATFYPDRQFAIIRLISGASAQTRTLSAPTKSGLIATLDMVTHGGGNIVVTVTGGYDEAGSTTLTFSAIGQFCTLISIEQTAGTYVWRVLAYDGVTGPSVSMASLALSGTLSVTGASTLTGGIAGGKPYNIGTWQPVAATSGTDTACTNGTAYVGSIFIPGNCTVTGIQYLIGSVGGTDKVIASLHSASGAVLANSATAGATVGTAANLQQVAFTSTYAAVGPQWGFIALTFNGTTAKFRSVPNFCNAGNGVIGNGVTQTFGSVAAFTPPTTFTADKVPVASLY